MIKISNNQKAYFGYSKWININFGSVQLSIFIKQNLNIYKVLPLLNFFLKPLISLKSYYIFAHARRKRKQNYQNLKSLRIKVAWVKTHNIFNWRKSDLKLRRSVSNNKKIRTVN